MATTCFQSIRDTNLKLKLTKKINYNSLAKKKTKKQKHQEKVEIGIFGVKNEVFQQLCKMAYI